MDACESAQVQAVQALLGADAQHIGDVAAFARATCLGARAAVQESASMRTLASEIDYHVTATKSSSDAGFMFFCAILVMFMQYGFAALCAGCVRSKNTVNILYKNTMDGLIAGVTFYCLGYGLAFGTNKDGSGNAFIGTGDFFLADTAENGAWQLFFFHWAVVAAVATIVAGGIAERCRVEAYALYTIWLSVIVYPVAAHWLWAPSGWMSWENEKPLLGVGVVDFAGTSVVHMTGGLSALVGTYFIGARKGRYGPDGKPNPDWDAGHSQMLVCTGTMVLWTGWYGFNSGSALFLVGREALVARTAVVSTMGACGGAVAALLHSQFITKTHSFGDLCNGALCGLVAITAGGCVIAPWAGILVGFIGALIFLKMEPLIAAFGIDDAVGASAMHGCIGTWGTLVPGLFARADYTRELMHTVGIGADYKDSLIQGLFYGGDGKLMACQIIAVIATAAWVIGAMTPLFATLKAVGLLRVSEHAEDIGLDLAVHGGPCYGEASEASPAQAVEPVLQSAKVSPE